jgi:hypothetical protein
MVVKNILESVGEALANIQELSVAECERAFNCQLSREEGKAGQAGQFWGSCPDLSIDVLDVRIGETGGVVVANFYKSVQLSLAEEIRSLGEPEAFSIVSPPMSPAASPQWSRKWSVAHTFTGVQIWYGMEEIEASKRMVFASRLFTYAT